MVTEYHLVYRVHITLYIWRWVDKILPPGAAAHHDIRHADLDIRAKVPSAVYGRGEQVEESIWRYPMSFWKRSLYFLKSFAKPFDFNAVGQPVTCVQPAAPPP